MARSLVHPNLRATLQASAEGLMPDTCAIVRDTRTSDSEGGMTTTETTVSTGACRLRTLATVSERTTADRLEWTVAYAIDLPLDVTVTPDERITVNGIRTFEIGAILKSGEWAHNQTAICQEVGS